MAHNIQVKSMQVASNMEKDKYYIQMVRKIGIHIKDKCETSDIMGKENWLRKMMFWADFSERDYSFMVKSKEAILLKDSL